MGQIVYWFKKEKVTVAIPTGVGIGIRKWRRLPPLSELRGPDGTPHPHRLVIGLEFYNLSNRNMEDIMKLPDCKAEIRVRWNPEDVNHVGGDYEKLKLYYFNNKGWQPFEKIKHGFDRIPDPGNNNFGWGVAYINNWEDPPIAWDA